MRKTRYSYLMQHQRRVRTGKPPNRPIVIKPREQIVLLDVEDRYEREHALADELEERWPYDRDEA